MFQQLFVVHEASMTPPTFQLEVSVLLDMLPSFISVGAFKRTQTTAEIGLVPLTVVI